MMKFYLKRVYILHRRFYEEFPIQEIKLFANCGPILYFSDILNLILLTEEHRDRSGYIF